jgi:PKD repeat protein
VDYGDGSGPLPGTVAAKTCSGPTHTYTSVGTKTVTVTVTDDDGGTGTANASHSVGFTFTGFFNPVDNPPTANRVKAGRAIPVKFSLGGNQGLGVIASFTSVPVACSTGTPTGDVEVTVTAGNSSLQYDPATATYTYVWKTDGSWATQCRLLAMTLTDGTVQKALFTFTK